MKIIYLSGIDGCGKTTQAKLLVESLNNNGITAKYMWFRWEPSIRKIVKSFRSVKTKNIKKNTSINIVTQENLEQDEWLSFKRKLLSNSLIRQFWLLYACLDYFLAYKKHFTGLNADVVVIDRYVNDFIIDQSVNLNFSPRQGALIKKHFFLKKIHFPDYSIIIDLPALEGYMRKSDGTPLKYLETRENYYKEMADQNTIHLDGLKPIEHLAAQIRKHVFKILEVKST